MLSLLFVLASLLGASISAVVPMTGINDWGGKFAGDFVFPITNYTDGWEAVLKFSAPITGFTQWMGTVVNKSTDNKMYVLVNNANTGIQQAGTSMKVTIQATYNGSSPPSGNGTLINMGHDNQTIPSIPPTPVPEKYNYEEIMMKSILFYEAQRSGKLPPTNRISWRGDSALGDKGDNGEDLTGGWYDAGDNVKFGFPMSASVTLLAWSLLEYRDAYNSSQQLDYMYDSIRWPLQWMLKCHTAQDELYVQVGDGDTDHASWTRPEDMTMARPAFKINASKPGSDVAAEFAAAMSVSYMLFKDKDPAFASQLLQTAKELYDFALQHQGLYSDSVPQAGEFYKSASYQDELSWGGAWLYRATNDSKYLASAEKYYPAGAAWGQSWDEKNTGAMILLYNMTKNDTYAKDIQATFTSWMPGGNVTYSPKGLAFRSQWGSLRYSANMAYMAMLAADVGIQSDQYRAWAKSQIHYALGDTGRSFIVGFGTNPPQRPHHRGSSCPMRPSPCSWSDQQQKGPNPHVLYGAMVGGPDGQDVYTDDRNNYVNNEVACDYNAGLQSAVAGLQSLALKGKLP